jgi:hypothetical protein
VLCAACYTRLKLQSPLSAVPKEQSGSHLVRGVSASSAPSSPRAAAKHHDDEVCELHNSTCMNMQIVFVQFVDIMLVKSVIMVILEAHIC